MEWQLSGERWQLRFTQVSPQRVKRARESTRLPYSSPLSPARSLPKRRERVVFLVFFFFFHLGFPRPGREKRAGDAAPAFPLAFYRSGWQTSSSSHPT